jgi:hypothetical protein
VFALLLAYSALNFAKSFVKTKADVRNLQHFFFFAVVGSAGIVFLAVVALTWAGEYCSLLLALKYLMLHPVWGSCEH